MGYTYAAFAIPAFFLFVGLEYFSARQQKLEHIFKYESSAANLSVGIAERLLNLSISGSFFQLYRYIYDHHAIFDISNHWLVWFGLIMITDLIWYWYHRLGHEVNILWGAHIVHHQSEEFNYTVSARITTFQALIRNIFWCLMPLIGFRPEMVITILIVHGAYSFFTHTQLLKCPVWLENIFVTPAIHGIHHASNEKYLNRNYGDVFVFWDKLFGTFATETEKPRYGLTHPLNSYSFMWQHFHYYLEIAEACRRVEGVNNKLKIIFGNPDILDQSIRPALETKYLPHKQQKKPSQKFKSYLNFQIVAAVVLLIVTTYSFGEMNTSSKVFAALFILITLINCGALLEQRRWIYYLEISRALLITGYISTVYDTYFLLVLSVITLLLLASRQPVQKWYLKTIYDN